MQIVINKDRIIASYDDSVAISPNVINKEIVIKIPNKAHSYLMGGFDPSNPSLDYHTTSGLNFKKITDVLTPDELKKAKIEALKNYYNNVIINEYPLYKQLNIIRQGNGYSKADIDTMNTFIDLNRSKQDAKEKEINTLDVENHEAIVDYDIYA